jgi:hypothetical protein
MTDEQFEARSLRWIIAGREYDRERYALAAAWHARTRAPEWTRGDKMSATYQLRKAERALDAHLTREV